MTSTVRMLLKKHTATSTPTFNLFRKKPLPQLIQKCREQMDEEANYSHKVSPEKKPNHLESLFKLAPNLHEYTPKHTAERSLRESRQMLCLGSKSEKSPGPKETFPHLLMCTLKKKKRRLGTGLAAFFFSHNDVRLIKVCQYQ